MKVTLDTNVLVSAFISKRGQPAKILDIILTFPEIKLILSNSILEEFGEVISRQEVRERFDYSEHEIESFVQAIRDISTIVKLKSNFSVIKEDPKDDIILNTAYDGKVDYIVSGDFHLQKLKKFKDIKIVSPKQMMKIITRRFGELIISGEKIEK
ncbi:MAG: putative toxin-antitoxin system toxin component, PIN family [archaeon]|nr:putative toxin-antitoxin system toxin component, PIN family [archaeon]